MLWIDWDIYVCIYLYFIIRWPQDMLYILLYTYECSADGSTRTRTYPPEAEGGACGGGGVTYVWRYT
jgi:hypothetical protein